MVRPKSKRPRHSKTIRIDQDLGKLDLTSVVHALEAFFQKAQEVASLERAGKRNLAKDLKYKLIEEIGMHIYKELRNAVDEDDWTGCMICGAEPLKDFTCRECGEYVLCDADEGTYSYNEDTGELYEPGYKGEFNSQIECKCGCKSFDADNHKFCGYHAYRDDKDRDRDDRD